MCLYSKCVHKLGGRGGREGRKEEEEEEDRTREWRALSCEYSRVKSETIQKLLLTWPNGPGCIKECKFRAESKS